MVMSQSAERPTFCSPHAVRRLPSAATKFTLKVRHLNLLLLSSHPGSPGCTTKLTTNTPANSNHNTRRRRRGRGTCSTAASAQLYDFVCRHHLRRFYGLLTGAPGQYPPHCGGGRLDFWQAAILTAGRIKAPEYCRFCTACSASAWSIPAISTGPKYCPFPRLVVRHSPAPGNGPVTVHYRTRYPQSWRCPPHLTRPSLHRSSICPAQRLPRFSPTCKLSSLLQPNRLDDHILAWMIAGLCQGD